MFAPTIGGLQETTNYKVVLPFYGYAAISFVIGAFLLLTHTHVFEANYNIPQTLSITHTMALGWGTMVIFGASYQLLPVLIEGKLQSDLLGYLTFAVSGIGIPILIIGFYQFDYGLLLPLGAILINVAVLCYFLNVMISSFKSEKRNIHAWYIITASLWLFSTTFFGLLLVLNFNNQFLPRDSWHYLTIHAHLGLVGWFLLMVIGVGSRLIPMFLISKYENVKLLRVVLILVNFGLINFVLTKSLNKGGNLYFISVLLVLLGIGLFGFYIKSAHRVRIRKKVDKQVRTSFISVAQLLIPLLILILIIAVFPAESYSNVVLLYGFTVFFGWITAIIIGMTFKTMPFIVWNREYKTRVGRSRTLAPKDLFSEKVYGVMLISYIAGFIIFIGGLLLLVDIILKIGAVLLLVAAILYFYNVFKTLFHKSE